MENKKSNSSNLFWTVITIIIIALIVKCSSSNDRQAGNSENSLIDSSAIITDTLMSAKHSWEYFDEQDKMTSEIKYYATIEANDLLYFDSPYDGGSTASFIVRHKDGYGNAFLKISKGQFIIHTDTKFRIRFDDEKPNRYSVSNPSDGSSDVVFFRYYQLIDKIKKHKKMIVEAEFYREGMRPIEFNIEGLKWEH